MQVLLLPGIWPPDVGGPATHAPELARFLVARGHGVRVVTMADGGVTERPCPVETVSRRLPFPARYSLLAAKAARATRACDVVYASATYAAAAAAASASRRPLVAKLVSDPAFERARRLGLFRGTLEEFQTERGKALAAVRAARTRVLRRAGVVVVPSEYLAAIAAGWGLPEGRLVVVPNAAPEIAGPPAPPREPPTFLFAGRLTRQKALGTAIDAVARSPRARLLVLGDGPDRNELERRAGRAGLDGRVVFAGARPRSEVLGSLAGAYAALLASDWENFPHAAVEALAVGVPVVATRVGGVPEIVQDGVNGLLVEPGSPEALARALDRLLDEPALRQRLAAAARPSVARLDDALIHRRLEGIIADTVES